MSARQNHAIGAEAVAAKGWLRAHKWLILRRTSQIGILLAFLIGPWFGLWLVKGNLSSSLTLGVLPLTDPLLLLQTLLTRHWPQTAAFVGAAIVVVFYLLVGGRSFCAWTCPVNLVTDSAAWLRRRLNLGGGAHLSRATRYWILAMTLIVAALTGTVAWEMVNPVSMLHRGLIFGMGFAWVVIAAIFLFDLFVVRNGWCGHLCPVGAFYGLIGRASLLRVQLPAREACNDCLDCFAVCPEHQIIRPPLKGVKGAAPIILDARCTNCGRCVDVCSKDVFAFGPRFGPPSVAASGQPTAEPK
ncbi:MAG TPA: quinol dehydrogenase ferredoxin subunit NapH [Burkholderiaceae bacterium]|nr:quinol dehydrogenase ferredoxin subunit NapH [Burkholderiaceae bacterium]HMX10554.1 quinol dehydrogenase ferredoxin subunit NapH [Burkholderiaceae bacterium]HMZ01782.1 quinol dehydrogenase ferredoxin subunit NapH [Burkholderiaceae bacterium]HNB45950.1 quinol dehydrogenase ferredoxin subunit NapH [Burkholderiaceae bacterium]HNG80074.1 quinol dehydrogenase ferredoxin subunit NapH [Burkholderiaceae bacterium]